MYIGSWEVLKVIATAFNYRKPGNFTVHIANIFFSLGCDFRKLILKGLGLGFRVSHIILIKASQGVQKVYLKSMHLRGQEGRPKRTGLATILSE